MTESTKMTLTPSQAEAFVRKQRGKTLFVAVGQSAPIADQPGFVFPVMAHIKVTRKDAVKFICEAYPAVMANKGAMCVISVLENCVFIGRAA